MNGRFEVPLPRGWKFHFSLGTDCFQLGAQLFFSPLRERDIELYVYVGFFTITVGFDKW